MWQGASFNDALAQRGHRAWALRAHGRGSPCRKQRGRGKGGRRFSERVRRARRSGCWPRERQTFSFLGGRRARREQSAERLAADEEHSRPLGQTGVAGQSRARPAEPRAAQPSPPKHARRPRPRHGYGRPWHPSLFRKANPLSLTPFYGVPTRVASPAVVPVMVAVSVSVRALERYFWEWGE